MLEDSDLIGQIIVLRTAMRDFVQALDKGYFSIDTYKDLKDSAYVQAFRELAYKENK